MNKSPQATKSPHQLGQKAEHLAASYLQDKGCCIVARNYRYKKAEIDLVAQKNTCLLFVEVKSRTSKRFGYPEAFVLPSKQALIREAAENYILVHDWRAAIRFDIIAILQTDGKTHITHLEDAFY